jgi:2-methylcitrate dehydratase PrpD
MKPALAFAFALAAQYGANAACPALNAQEEQRVETLLAKMSLAEKVEQMRMFHANTASRLDPKANGITLRSNGQLSLGPDIEARFVNGIAGIKNPGEKTDPVSAARLTNALQKHIIDASPSRTPALFVAEA